MTKSGEKLLKILPFIEDYQRHMESNYALSAGQL
jgi:hypothetical protein